MVVSDDIVRRVQGRVGMTLSGKWRLLHVLGIGGMAAVYAAIHRNQHRVAIKMLHPELSIHEAVRTRFLREGYVANSVEHPGAVRVHDDGVSDDGAAYLVMELLEGESLEDRRQRHGGRLSVPEVIALADQLLETLAVAHGKGIVHRDIKPENLFLTLEGELKVLDFGIARLRELSDPGSGTAAGIFMGTPSFMSPEQARSRWEEVDVRSDLWSVGASLFTLLSGHLVHEAETVTEQLVLAAREPAPALLRMAPDVPFSVASIVDKALAFRPLDRWQDAQDMRAAVRAVAREVGPPRTLSVRAATGPVNGDTDTLLAASDSAPSGVTTGAAIDPRMTSQPGAEKPSARGRWLVVAGIGLIAAALAALVWPKRLPRPAAAPVIASAPEVSATSHGTSLSPDLRPPPSADTPAEAARETAPRTNVPAVSPRATPPRRTAGREAAPRPTPAPSASAASVPSTGSLLDRRF